MRAAQPGLRGLGSSLSAVLAATPKVTGAIQLLCNGFPPAASPRAPQWAEPPQLGEGKAGRGSPLRRWGGSPLSRTADERGVGPGLSEEVTARRLH